MNNSDVAELNLKILKFLHRWRLVRFLQTEKTTQKILKTYLTTKWAMLDLRSSLVNARVNINIQEFLHEALLSLQNIYIG